MTTLTQEERQELLQRLPEDERELYKDSSDEEIQECVSEYEEIARLRTSIAERESSIAQHDTSIAQHDTSIAQHDTSIAQHDTSIARHQAKADQHSRNAYEIAKRHVGEERARPLLGDHTTMVETRRTKESCCVML